MKVVKLLITLSCLFSTPCLPDSSASGIIQARILEWVAILFSRRSSRPRDQTPVSHIAGTDSVWATREVHLSYRNMAKGISLVVQWLRLHASTVRGMGFIPWSRNNLAKKKKKDINKFVKQSRNTPSSKKKHSKICFTFLMFFCNINIKKIEVLLRYNWHISLYRFKVYSIMIGLIYVMKWL